MENKRSSWGSNIGFLLAAIGSAVGLGNIWGFPYKMGKCGGFTFLVVYILLAVFVGFIIMVSELALGRSAKQGVIGTYNKFSKRFKWVGWLAIIAPFLIMSFYSALGGYCIQYMSLNLSALAFGDTIGIGAGSGANLFSGMLTNPLGCVIFTFFFVLICYFIVKGGVSSGIEKFNKIGMPALFVMLVIIIIRSLSLPGAVDGLKYMFVPGWSVANGYIEEAPNFVSVLATAGGQMFFSLSLAMGVMFTYGSYLKSDENLVKNSLVIVFSDTIIALMAGLAVIPAAIATYGTEASLSGPSLLFVTLQDVFASMGAVGPIFGILFYLLVLVAAISSAISLIEVITTFFLDNAEQKGKKGDRSRTTMWVSIAICLEAILVAVDGLGSNGIWVPFQKLLGVGGWNDCWLDFMDCWSEGIAMPLGALLMSIMVGWEIKPKAVLEEVQNGFTIKKGFKVFYMICIKFIVPIAMALILLGQVSEFFGLHIFG